MDAELFEKAKAACVANTDTDPVRLGLEAFVGCAAHERLRSLAELNRKRRMCRGAVIAEEGDPF